jgi:N-hydroxyarylamine O-acetyltransferase
MNLAAFLQRIGFWEPACVDHLTLQKLHTAFVTAIPFENLDILSGHHIKLETNAIYEKIVSRHRGGICYELNGLFAEVLHEIGFDVTLLAGRVINTQTGEPGREFAHLLLLVNLDRRWIADVGFGEWATQPLWLDTQTAQICDGIRYRIRPDSDRFVAEQWITDGEGRWKPRYSFDLIPRTLPEFSTICEDLQNDPESAFREHHFCTLRTPQGRVTLTEEKLIIVHEGARREILLDGPKGYTTALRDYFGITL